MKTPACMAVPSPVIDVRYATFGLSPFPVTPGTTGQPVTPLTNQSPLIDTMPSLFVPLSDGHGPAEARSPAARQMNSAVPLLTGAQTPPAPQSALVTQAAPVPTQLFTPITKTRPVRSASGSPV